MCRQVNPAIAFNDADCGRCVRYVLEKVSCLRSTGLYDLGIWLVSDTDQPAPDVFLNHRCAAPRLTTRHRFRPGLIPGLFRLGILFGYREENFSGFVPDTLCNACALSF